MEHAVITHTLSGLFLRRLAQGAVAFWFGLAGLEASACTTSTYSSVGEKDCSAVPVLETERRIVSGQGEYAFECSGAPQGYKLYFVDSDRASWYVTERDGVRHSFERVIVYENPPGNFPHVGQGGKVEWLTENGAVKGLIFRVGYQKQDGSGNFSRLFSVALDGAQAVVRGSSYTNEAARQLLDYCP
jgi:hypothetical protein